jgi:hypothetical protein
VLKRKLEMHTAVISIRVHVSRTGTEREILPRTYGGTLHQCQQGAHRIPHPLTGELTCLFKYTPPKDGILGLIPESRMHIDGIQVV